METSELTKEEKIKFIDHCIKRINYNSYIGRHSFICISLEKYLKRNGYSLNVNLIEYLPEMFELKPTPTPSTLVWFNNDKERLDWLIKLREYIEKPS